MAGLSQKQDGKETIALIGVLLILIIVVGGALLYVITQKAAEPVPPEPNATKPPVQNLSNITNATPPSCGGECLLGAIVGAKNVSACAELENLSQACYLALSNESLDACRKVENSTAKKECISALANSSRDIKLCDELAEGKEECQLAVDPCMGEADAKLCRALAGSDPSRCGASQACLVNYSMQKNDASACALIQNAVVSAACKSTLAGSDKCWPLTYLSERDYCYQLFAQYSNEYLTCTQITPNSIYALDCFSDFAVRLNNLSICDDDGFGLNERWACYTNYSLNSGDISGCQKIDKLASTNKFRCTFEYAKKYGDPSACQVMDDLGARATCYEGTIIYSNQNLDYHHCKDVTSFKWMNQCYTAAAKLNGDVSLCDYIDETFARESCKGSYALNEG